MCLIWAKCVSVSGQDFRIFSLNTWDFRVSKTTLYRIFIDCFKFPLIKHAVYCYRAEFNRNTASSE